MQAIVGFFLALVFIFGPIIVIPKLYERRHPHATVGEVGPLILLVLVLEIAFLFLLIAAGGK